MTEEIKQGMTRREVLKKGAIVGGTMGAVMWVAPVVRAQAITPGAAKIPSEGTCCLRVFLSVEKAGADSIDIHWKVKNCGPSLDSNVRTWVDESTDGGTNWTDVDFANFATLTSGQENTQDLTRLGLSGGSYLYRIHSLYDCGGSQDLWHNVPGDPYPTRGPIAI